MSQARMIESRAVRKETVNITTLEGLPHELLREEQIRLATGRAARGKALPKAYLSSYRDCTDRSGCGGPGAFLKPA